MKEFDILGKGSMGLIILK